MQDQSGRDTKVRILEELGVDAATIAHADDDALIDELWAQTLRNLAAELRLMGRLAGIDDTGAYNPDAPEVKETREKIMEALRDFFVVDARAELNRLEALANQQREALLQKYPGAEHYIDKVYPSVVLYGADTPTVISTNHGPFTQAGSGAGVDFVGGLSDIPSDLLGVWDGSGGYAGFEAAEVTKTAFLDDLKVLAETIKARELADEAALNQQIANVIDIFRSAWEGIKNVYDNTVELLKAGQYQFALHYATSQNLELVGVGIIAIIAGLLSGGSGAVVLAVSKSVFHAVVRTAIHIAPSAHRVRSAAAAGVMNVSITKMRLSSLDGAFEPGPSLGSLRSIDTNDLPPNERRLVDTTEGSQGSHHNGDDPVDETPERTKDAQDRNDDNDTRDREDVGEDGSYRNPKDPDGVRRAPDGEAMVKNKNGDWTRVSKVDDNHIKGAFGETMADDWAANKGWEKLNGPNNTMDTPGHQGIDGVYRDPGPPPRYVVADAKYGSADLGTLVDGTKQMSPKWIRDRLDDAVGDERLARKISKDHDAGVLRVDKNGNVTFKSLANRKWRDEDQ
ncbi:MAG: hypothetical protein ACRBCL_04060 [Maritimibacter sp.]